MGHLTDLLEREREVFVVVLAEDRLTELWITDDAVGDRLDPLLPEPGPVGKEDGAINTAGAVNRPPGAGA